MGEAGTYQLTLQEAGDADAAVEALFSGTSAGTIQGLHTPDGQTWQSTQPLAVTLPKGQIVLRLRVAKSGLECAVGDVDQTITVSWNKSARPVSNGTLPFFTETSMRTIYALLVLLIAMLPALPARAEDPPSISTTGQATVYVVPDKVLITLGVHTYAPTLDEARKNNEGASAELVKALKAVGVAANDIGTDQLRVDIRYKDMGNNTDIEGFLVQRLLCDHAQGHHAARKTGGCRIEKRRQLDWRSLISEHGSCGNIAIRPVRWRSVPQRKRPSPSRPSSIARLANRAPWRIQRRLLRLQLHQPQQHDAEFRPGKLPARRRFWRNAPPGKNRHRSDRLRHV